MYEVSKCPCVDCPLFPYRFGRRPSTMSKPKKVTETHSRLPDGEEKGAHQNEGEKKVHFAV